MLDKINAPTRAYLRYFARFKGVSGHLRVAVHYGTKSAKFVVLPIGITAEQSSRLDSAGFIKDPQTIADRILDKRLRACTPIIFGIVSPLIDSGAFNDTPGERLAAQICDVVRREVCPLTEEERAEICREMETGNIQTAVAALWVCGWLHRGEDGLR